MGILLRVKKTKENAIIPTLGSEYAAGYDLYANLTEDELVIRPNETVKIGTGIAVEIPKGYFGGVFARSGIATKRGLRPANCVGVIDADYRGEVIVALHNDSSESQTIQNEERIAQLVVIPFLEAEIEIVKDLNKTDRGDGGFGSSDNRMKMREIDNQYEQLSLDLF